MALEQINQKSRDDQRQSETSSYLEGIANAIYSQTKMFVDRFRQEDAEKDPFGIRDAMDQTTQQLQAIRAGGNASYGGRSSGWSEGSSSGGVLAYNPDSKVGDTIARFESGNAGVNKIGYDRMGGTSYGKWQLASKTGSYEDWLKHLEAKGGKGAEIAAQLRAAGPANTGGKTGHHVDVYKKLAAENAKFFEETQRESLLKNNYDVSIGKIKSESLRKMIAGDKSIQEMLFSTSVQHGGAGGAKVFNNAWKEGMSREDFIKAVYDYRGTQFGGSTQQVRKSVQKRFGEERDLILGMNAGEAKVKEARQATQAAIAQGGDAAVSAGMSMMFADATQKAMDNGVKYKLGARNSASGQIDCSGWVTEMGTRMMQNMNQAMQAEVFSKEKIKKFRAAGTSENIVQAVSDMTGGKILRENDLTPDKAKEGMVIGLDTGHTSFDAGRKMGIDHIVQTYRDPQTGELMVSESQGGTGVTKSSYSKWYERQMKKGRKLFGADMTAMADSNKIAPKQPESLAQIQQQAQTAAPVEAKINAPTPEALEAARAKVKEAEKEFAESGYTEVEALQLINKPAPKGKRESRDFDPGKLAEDEAIGNYHSLQSARAELAKLEEQQKQASIQAQAVSLQNHPATVAQGHPTPANSVQTSPPESLAQMQALQSVLATNTRKPERPESIREIDPSREVVKQSAQDNGPLLAILGQLLQAFESGNSKLISAVQNLAQNRNPSINMDYGDAASRAMANG